MWGRFSPPPILDKKDHLMRMNLTKLVVVPTVSMMTAVLLAASPAAVKPTSATQPKPVAQPKPKALAKVPPKPSANQILVRVNGVNITRGQLNRYMDMMVVLLKNKRKTTPPELIAKFRRKKLVAFSNDIYRRTLFATCLAHSNIVVTAATRAAVEKDCLAGYGRPKQTFAELKSVMEKSGFAKEFADNLEFDVRLRAFVTTVYSNRYYVSEADIKKVKAGLAAYNRRAEATNQVTLAHAAAVRKRAMAGEDFGKLADAYSEDEEKQKGGLIGDCDESDFADEKEIWRKLSGLKENAVSEVLETEDGYVLYKVLRRNNAEKSQTGGESLTLARIFFRRAYLFPPQTDDELRVDVEKEMRDKLLSDLYKVFRAQSDVTYPNGHIKAP